MQLHHPAQDPWAKDEGFEEYDDHDGPGHFQGKHQPAPRLEQGHGQQGVEFVQAWQQLQLIHRDLTRLLAGPRLSWHFSPRPICQILILSSLLPRDRPG